MEIKVVITDDQRDDGLRGEGVMSSTNALEVYFEPAPGRQRRGVMEAEGDIPGTIVKPSGLRGDNRETERPAGGQ